MSTAGYRRWAPAAIWRAFFVFAAFPAGWLRAGPPLNTPAPEFAQSGPADQAEGRAVLARFRESEGSPPYYLEFDLRQMPRRGAEHLFHGRLWCSQDDRGPVWRIEISPGTPDERRFLVQNGTAASVWMSESNGPSPAPRRIGPFAPLIPGVEITPFELQMPYLYWADTQLVGVRRMSNRPAYLFLFRPPAGFAGPSPDFQGVRAYLDTEYNAPVQTELLGRDDRTLKTLSLIDLKKVGEHWFPKDLDVRNETTRDKTRFSVTAAAMDQRFPPEIFSPSALTAPAAPPAGDRLVRLEP